MFLNIKQLSLTGIGAILVLTASCQDDHTATSQSGGSYTPKPKDWSQAQLVWSDEFDGSTLNLNEWKLETGAHGWGNNELQNYVDSGAVEVSNGTLKITAAKVGPGQQAGDYTSARLNSIRTFTTGRMEIRAKLPTLQGKGLWPAIWMLGTVDGAFIWPDCGEIDIMEYVSYTPHTVYSTLHSRDFNHVKGNPHTSGPIELMDAEDEFHIYGLLWVAGRLSFYIDDISNITYDVKRSELYQGKDWPFYKPYYFLINMAVGGNWGGAQGVDDSIFPAVFEIDYVRVYQ